MSAHAQPQGNFDGYDLWQLVSYAGTALSVIGLAANPKLREKMGTAAAVFGASSAAHAALTPPRCPRCRRRMDRLGAPAYAPRWTCRACGYQRA